MRLRDVLGGMSDLEHKPACYLCQKPSNRDSLLSTCIGIELYNAFKDGPLSSDTEVTGQRLLREEAQATTDGKQLREKMIKWGCARRFHQVCASRRPEAAFDHKYFDSSKQPSGEVSYQSRDIKHRLCPCCHNVMYGEGGPQSTTQESCQV